ncbi:PXYLP1 [Branchiostoma lanceolatum]|uniref:2-phosphoxylose phosphatase 1 n=1 Tax=Branchiostoma lanceolatum TaxID=7740 RepID=A0A8J9VTP8_BRALA|nr:PXYLP1 [Branchiostoma lanceolatum]
MRRKHAVILLATFCLISCLTVFLISTWVYEDPQGKTKGRHPKYASSQRVKIENRDSRERDGIHTPNRHPSFGQQFLEEYCNVPNASVSGEEGEAPPGYQLESVQLLIRHGDRTTQYAIPGLGLEPWNCKLDPDRSPSHSKLPAFINSVSALNPERLDKPLHMYSAYPQAKVCKYGHLTQQGVVQHLYNGEHLHNVYIKKWKLLLPTWNRSDVLLMTTQMSRTYHSAMAFLYTFLPTFDAADWFIHAVNSLVFCHGGKDCECSSKVMYFRKEASRYAHRTESGEGVARVLKEIAHTFEMTRSQLGSLTHVLDLFNTHLCHKIDLPCGGKTCLKMKQFETLIKHFMENNRMRAEEGVFASYAALEMNPMLSDIVSSMERFAAGEDGVHKFVLYSGHDVTVSPLLYALGIPETKWCPYATRVVFELWRASAGVARYVRVLYNGVNVTDQLKVCASSTDGMCPLESFASFIKKGVFQQFGADSYQDACMKMP